ncbi:MAG: C-type lectin domain-containing protein, partial [Flavobacteriaceae bacterium]|nr:C-type lectin domain-containing protein [Flavobacteriaceae bacterium]
MLAIPNPVEEFGGVEPHRLFQGMTIHVATPQCNAGSDSIFFPTTPTFFRLRHNSHVNLCALFVQREANGTRYMEVARRAAYRSTEVPPKLHVTIAWVLWLVPEQFAIFDVETRHVYFFHQPASPRSAERAREQCADLGASVSLALHPISINNRHENDLVRRYNNVNASAQYALNFVVLNMDRSAPTLPFRLPGEAITFTAWAPNEPNNNDPDGPENCVEYFYVTQKWYSVVCTTKPYPTLICEAPNYSPVLASSLVFRNDPNPTQTVNQLAPPIPFSRLPSTGLSDIIFGATLMTSVDDCAPGDYYLMGDPHDNIVHINVNDRNPCRMFLGGTASVETFNLVLGWTTWRTSQLDRLFIRHAAV